MRDEVFSTKRKEGEGMRTFDYRHLPQTLFGGKAGDANVRLYEDKGKLDLLEKTHATDLEALRVQAHFDNVDASMRIEGLYVDQARVRSILEGDAPLGETEAQIAGYSKALRALEDNTAEFGLNTTTMLALYEALYAYRDLGRKSRYRKKDYLYVQVDGHMQAMPVSPITAFETPLVLGGACDSLSDAFDANSCSPLILSAVFTVDFLCIRPFDEGNGRIARLFANLLLMKAGINVARYQSIDRIIEETAMDYYDALNACVEGWERGANDYTPYVRYWLDVVNVAYERLFEHLEAQNAVHGVGKTQRVRLFVQQAGEPVTKRQIRAALPDISEATVENALGAMVKAGEVQKLGASRSTSYLWK